MNKKISIHFIAWSIFFLYELIIKGQLIEHPDDLGRQLVFVSIRVSCLILLVYFVLYILFERFYQQSKKALFFCLLPCSILLCAYLMRSFNYWIYWKPRGEVYHSIIEVWSQHLKTVIYCGNISFVLGMAALFYFVNKWNEQDKKRRVLENIQKEAQLQQLRSQIQPHFLFNTLNNIQALAKKDAALTSESIFRLSNLLEKSVYKVERTWSPLQEELSYIQDYIALEKLRYGDRLEVVINIFCDLAKWQIPSFTLLPFVENAFKHGLSQQTDKSYLSIEINEQAEDLLIKIENSVDQGSPSIQSGIGIKNIAKRLKLLYEERQELQLSNQDGIFLVKLKLRNMQRISYK